MKQLFVALALLYIGGAVWALNVSDPNEVMGAIPQSVQTILAANALPSIDEGEEILEKKCLKNGQNDSYENVKLAKDRLSECVRDLVDVETVQKEIEDAKPKGDLDTVFKKYCGKSPELKECVSSFMEAMEPCLNPEEKGSKESLMNVTNSLMNFICFKGGDRIALFIAEGGTECIQSKLEVIQTCLNESLSKYTEEGASDVENLPELTFDKNQCRDMTMVQACIVKELEHCDEPTPANIVDSLFNFVRKSTPCKDFKSALTADGASSLGLPITLGLSALAFVLLLL